MELYDHCWYQRLMSKAKRTNNDAVHNKLIAMGHAPRCVSEIHDLGENNIIFVSDDAPTTSPNIPLAEQEPIFEIGT